MHAAGFEGLAQWALKDELGWNYGGARDIWQGDNNVSGNPRILRRFHQYLMNHTGFTEPRQFGVSNWAGVVPLYRRNLTQLLAEPAVRASCRPQPTTG
jgi:hypothetical protein